MKIKHIQEIEDGEIKKDYYTISENVRVYETMFVLHDHEPRQEEIDTNYITTNYITKEKLIELKELLANFEI